MGPLRFTYVTYLESRAERVWAAITDAEQSVRYWDHRNTSDWQVGSRWEHRQADGDGTADVVGTVLESSPPTRLRFTWASPSGAGPGGPSEVSFTMRAHGPIVRLTLVHDGLADEAEREALAHGWSAVLANLKTFLETGHALAVPPWEVPD